MYMIMTTIIFSLVCGVILCFFGYRSFRLAMALAGFVVGAGIGYFIYNLVSEYLPAAASGVWILVFMGGAGILLGLLSFRIYKAALFYISMFVTAFIILKTFLITAASGIGITAFFMMLFGRTSVGGAANALTDLPIGGSGTVGTAVASALQKLPGSTSTEKFWVAVGAALVAGAIVGIIVCLVQKPAIIVITSVFGGILISQGLFSLIGNFGDFDMRAEKIVASFAGGGSNLALSAVTAVAFIVIGILVQFKTAGKTA